MLHRGFVAAQLSSSSETQERFSSSFSPLAHLHAGSHEDKQGFGWYFEWFAFFLACVLFCSFSFLNIWVFCWALSRSLLLLSKCLAYEIVEVYDFLRARLAEYLYLDVFDFSSRAISFLFFWYSVCLAYISRRSLWLGNAGEILRARQVFRCYLFMIIPHSNYSCMGTFWHVLSVGGWILSACGSFLYFSFLIGVFWRFLIIRGAAYPWRGVPSSAGRRGASQASTNTPVGRSGGGPSFGAHPDSPQRENTGLHRWRPGRGGKLDVLRFSLENFAIVRYLVCVCGVFGCFQHGMSWW